MDSRRKNILLGILIVGIISMTIAFAAFSTSLNLNGTANVDELTWNIRFENWQKVSIITASGHTNTAESPSIQTLEASMSDETNVTKVDNIDITLNQPGDTAKYTFEIVNKGTIDAKLNNFTATLTPSNNSIAYVVKCYSNNSYTGDELTTNSVLTKNNGTAYCYLQVTYKDVDNAQTPGQNQVYEQNAINTSISASWTWVQSDTNSSNSESGNSGNSSNQEEPLFSFYEDSGTLAGFNSNYEGEFPEELVIPSQIDGVDVTSIESNAFSDCNLTSVVIPDTVTEIGDYAFYNSQLTELTIPDSVTTIGEGAFDESPLETLTLGNNIETIGDYAFSNSQLTELTIPDSVTEIGGYAFQESPLETLTLGNNVETIGDFAFEYAQLTELTIPDSVTTIGYSAFDNSPIETLVIGDGITTITSDMFPDDSLISLTLGDSVQSIEDYAFTNSQLTSLTLGNNVETIGDYAFYPAQLTELTLPDSVTEIGDYAFGDSQLTELTLGNSVETIGDFAFSNSQLTELTIPDSVTTIGYSAFSNSQLTELTIPDSVTTIGGYAFSNSQLTELTIGSSVQSIGFSALHIYPPSSVINKTGGSINWCDAFETTLVDSNGNSYCEFETGTVYNEFVDDNTMISITR